MRRLPWNETAAPIGPDQHVRFHDLLLRQGIWDSVTAYVSGLADTNVRRKASWTSGHV